jgi:hypothetical protein
MLTFSSSHGTESTLNPLTNLIIHNQFIFQHRITFTVAKCCVINHALVCVGWVVNHATSMLLQRCIQFLPKCFGAYWRLYSRTVNWVSPPLSFERMIRLLTSTSLLDQSYMKPTGWSCRSVALLQGFSVQKYGVQWHQNSTENISCARQARNWYTYLNSSCNRTYRFHIATTNMCHCIAAYVW